MRINVAIPEAHVDAPILDAALESVTRLNQQMLKKGEVPSFDRALKYGIKWRPEPPGAEHFDHAATVLARKWGDCDDLAPWHAASLRESGTDPGATAIVRRSGPQRWHAVVRRSDGSIDDPSKRAGMGAPRGVRGATLPMMPLGSAVVGGSYVVRPQIALRPVVGGWQARADIPWNYLNKPESPTDLAIAALNASPVPSSALTGAIDGAVELAIAAGIGEDDHLARLLAVSDLVQGADLDEIANVYGDEHALAAQQIVGGFFGGLKKLAKKALSAVPIASKLVQFVPGVGPIASTALDVAARAIPRGSAPGVAPVATTAQPLQYAPGAGPYSHVAVPSHAKMGRLCIPAVFE